LKGWLGHSNGGDITNRYSKLSENLELRRTWAERVGTGLDLSVATEILAPRIVRNVLGEEIGRIPARDLCNQDLHGKQWMHDDLSGMSLFGANLEGANLFGARLYRTDFQKASLAAQSLRSVTQPAQIFEERIFGGVRFIEQRLVCAEVERHPRILRIAWLTRPQTYQSMRFLVSGGCREGHTPDLLSGDRHSRGFSVQAAARP
jgi:hypothetical protein